jgi:hypothetical protein
MTRDHVRALGELRMAEAQHRRLLDEARRPRRVERRQQRQERRDQRRDQRRETGGWWRGVRARKRVLLSTVPVSPAEDVAVELARLLEGVADRVSESGTESEREALQAVSDATRVGAPGAAEALVDWEGTEAARLRAFGILHGVVLHVLGPEDCAWLLDRLRRLGDPQAGHRVA